MTITNVLAVITVADMDGTRAWYERLLGRPADRIPMPEASEWQLTPVGGIQLVLDPERAGSAMITLSVDDLVEHARELQSRGIAVGEIGAGDVFNIATFADPEGNMITLAEPVH